MDIKNIYREGGNIFVDMTLDLSKVKMKANIETVYTPMFVNGTDTLRMTSFSIAGRNRMYWDERNNAVTGPTFYKKKLLGGSTQSHDGNAPGISITPTAAGAATGNTGEYDVTVYTMYRDWMETATFTIDTENIGCANCLKDKDREPGEGMYAMAQTDFVTRSFAPEFVYVTPVAEAIKMREISARAYIDFVVNRIEINPSYRRNPQELAKIRATIDSVKNDKDIKITALHINGTASPEGSYQNNIRLAKGRTEALKDYVQGLYRFPAGFITTSFEPVDWAGLEEYLVGVLSSEYQSSEYQNPTNNQPQTTNSLPHASQILGIVRSDLEPVARNNKIRNTYPQEYAWLLENVYPALRHSDYRIEFEIKTYTEVSEILEVMATRPQNLSLAELFVAANSQEFGSELYDQAFDLAVTMYPDDETANLNAGINALRRGDVMSAERYLPKGGSSPEAEYARALLLLAQGDQEGGLSILRSLRGSLNPQVSAAATKAVDGLEEMARTNSRTFVRL